MFFFQRGPEWDLSELFEEELWIIEKETKSFVYTVASSMSAWESDIFFIQYCQNPLIWSQRFKGPPSHLDFFKTTIGNAVQQADHYEESWVVPVSAIITIFVFDSILFFSQVVYYKVDSITTKKDPCF